jgi:hypothetical protein
VLVPHTAAIKHQSQQGSCCHARPNTRQKLKKTFFTLGRDKRGFIEAQG